MAMNNAQAQVVSGLLESEGFHQIMREVQLDLFNAWCGETDQEGRERIYNEMRGIETVWDTIRSLAHEMKTQSGDTQ